MRRRIGLVLLLAALIAPAAYAAFYDFEQITVDNTVAGKSLTAAKVAVSLIYVQCRVRTAEISWLTVDPAKTTLSTTVGQLAEPGDMILITGREEALNLRMIRTGATSGQVDCSFKYSAAP